MAFNSNMDNRKLPEIDIAGTKFYVDATSMELIEAGNVKNRITVADMMTLDDHHEFLYDKKSKNIKEGRWDESQGDDQSRCEYVWIRRMESLDPDGMRMLEQSGRITPFNRNLPVVNIAGADFYWDASKAEFSQVSNVWNKIYKNDLTEENGKRGFFLDTMKCHALFSQEIDYYKSLPSMPQHVAFVERNGILKKLKNQEKQTDELLPKSDRARKNWNRGKGI